MRFLRGDLLLLLRIDAKLASDLLGAGFFVLPLCRADIKPFILLQPNDIAL